MHINKLTTVSNIFTMVKPSECSSKIKYSFDQKF